MMSVARGSDTERRSRLLTTGLLLVVSLPGCSRNEEALLGRAIPVKPSQVLSGRPLNGRTFTVGVALPPHSAFSREVQAGMEAAAADNEVKLDLRFARPADADPRDQVKQLLAKKVNALLVWAASPGEAAGAVRAADAVETPVFTIGAASDRSRATAHFITAAPFAELSPDQMGRAAVDRVAAYLRGEKLKPRVVIRPDSADPDRIK